MKKTTILLIALWMVAVIVIAPVSAGDCVVPPDEYFLVDGPQNGQPEHDGLQLGNGAFWITAQQRTDAFWGSHYLGLTDKTYIPGKSHNEQEYLAFAKHVYCDSLPDYPYKPALTDDERAAASPYAKKAPVEGSVLDVPV